MSQPESIDRRLRKGDENVVKIGSFSMTYNELHSTILGFGFGTGLGWSAIAYRTIKREPWWFLFPLLIGIAVARYFSRE